MRRHMIPGLVAVLHGNCVVVQIDQAGVDSDQSSSAGSV